MIPARARRPKIMSAIPKYVMISPGRRLFMLSVLSASAVNHCLYKNCQTSGKKCKKSSWVRPGKWAFIGRQNKPYRYPIEIKNKIKDNSEIGYCGTVFV
jgi:hypothetical protein